MVLPRQPVEGYTFLRFPVVDGSAQEELVLNLDAPGSGNPDARVWRYVSQADARRASIFTRKGEQGERHRIHLPNLLVEFVVVGHRPDALVTYLSGGA